ncbi:MAG: protein kinase [Candidatus Competibacteraceae bacterium]|nr:protein kinase [Candidatus Competibacteraceae bacterium]
MRIPGYQIERELGQGGMAIVYLAIQESLNRHVALKIIKPILTTDEEFAHRFLREGRIIAQLNDAHIITVYDIGSHDNIYYLSMEYLPGGTLQQRIRDGLALKDALSITRAIASALQYAHGRNIIHRDIKPQNILFRENGSPVLTDFGIAKTLGGSTVMTRTGLSIGTPRYMSPEQIRGQTVDARADLYSLGVLFHEMLTGNVPYTAEDSFALAMMHVTAPVPELLADLARFQPLLNKLLEKEPAQRLQNGNDIIAALDAIESPANSWTGSQETLVPLIKPDTASRHGPGWKIGLPLAAIALAGAVLAGGYLILNQPTEPSVTLAPPVAEKTPAGDPATQRRTEADQLLAQASEQQRAGALGDSLARIEQGLRLAPDHAGLLALRERVNGQIGEEERNRQARDQQRQAVLQAEQFLERAQQARQEGALDVSLVHIEQGLQAMPDHAALLTLKKAILVQQAERQRQEKTARLQMEAAEQRQKAEAERLKVEAERQRTEIERQRAEVERQRAEAERLRAENEQRRRKADEFLRRALGQQRDHAYEASLAQIEQGLQQAPDHSRLLALRDEVRRQLREAKEAPPPAPVVTPPPNDATRLATLLKKCAAHLKANRLTSGRGGNAADCYHEALRLDEGNGEASAGLTRVADRYADEADAALRRKNNKATRAALDKLAELNPADARLPDLRERLDQANITAKPAAPPLLEQSLNPTPSVASEPPPAAEKPVSPAPVASPEPPPGPSNRARDPATSPIELVSLTPTLTSPAKPVDQPALPQPPSTRRPNAPSERAPKPEMPPIELVSPASPATQPPTKAPDTQIIAQDRHTRISRTETDQEVSMLVTVSPQGTLSDQPSATPDSAQKPTTAAQAWAAVKDSSDPAELERFLTAYPKTRQASAARAKLNQLKKQPAPPARLAVRADVEDAQVTVNGRNIGTTPVEVEVKPGSYKVRVSLEGYQDWNGKVDLAAGDDSTLSAALPKKLAAVTAPATARQRTAEPKPQPEPESEPETDDLEKPAVTRNPAPAPTPAPTSAREPATKAAQGSSCLRGNCQNGQGTYHHPDGSEYSGEFRNAKMHGQGTYTYAGRGEKYVGEWRNGVINGQGTYYYRTGNRYQGDWRNGRKNGQGTYFYAGGEKYVGEFENDQPNGQGVYYYRNGDRYEGEWQNGRKDGQGVLYEDGKRLVGEWRNDQKVRIVVER